MKLKIKEYYLLIEMSFFALLIFVLWGLTGMPSPGFAGRLIPIAWLMAALLNGKTNIGSFVRNETDKWLFPVIFSFSISSWLWQLHPNLWYLVSAIPIGGLIVWAFKVAKKIGVIRAVLPILFLSLLIAEVNGDEVRFAEQSVAITFISSESYSEVLFRSGDISTGVGHHTPVFSLFIAPGLLFGDWGLRIIPALFALFGVYLISKISSPQIAVASALLYPGFSIFGLAMTGWLAVVLFLIALLLPAGKKWQLVRFFIALFLIALKMRYLGLAVGILISEYLILPTSRNRWKIVFSFVAVVFLVLIIDKWLLNGMIFWVRYGNIDALQLVWASVFYRPLETLSNMGYSLFDPEAGLLFRAPWVITALPGVVLLKKDSPVLFKKLFIPSVLYLVVVIIWSGSAWHGLPAPVGRVFVPLLPLFAASLVYTWSRSSTKILVTISIFVSSIVLAFPEARYNQADGTDSLLQLFQFSPLLSMVRNSSLLLIIPFILLMLALLILKKYKKHTESVPLITVFYGALLILSFQNKTIQAEDMSAIQTQGAGFYPIDIDAVERYYWPDSRERLLVLSEYGQSISITDVIEGDSLYLWLSGNEGNLQIGRQHLFVHTDLLSLSATFASVRGNMRILPDLPENRNIQLYKIEIFEDDIISNSVLITHFSGSAVYFDKLQLVKGTCNE